MTASREGEECRLYLVPDAVLKSWQRSQRLADIDRPEDSALAVQDASVAGALGDHTLPPRDRDVMVQQRTGKFLDAKKRRDQRAARLALNQMINSSSKGSHPQEEEEDMFASLPQTYRSKARTLLTQWTRDKDVSWDENNRVFLRGVPLHGSNIIDLVHHAVTKRKAPSPPPGFRMMKQHGLDVNHPQAMYPNPMWHDDGPRGEEEEELLDPPPSFSPRPISRDSTPLGTSGERRGRRYGSTSLPTPRGDRPSRLPVQKSKATSGEEQTIKTWEAVG